MGGYNKQILNCFLMKKHIYVKSVSTYVFIEREVVRKFNEIKHLKVHHLFLH